MSTSSLIAPRLAFDRVTGAIEGAGLRQKFLVRAFQAGARISSSWTHRGFGVGCRALRPLVPLQDMHVHLNDDTVFAFPFGDEYWSTILDRNYVYERDIDLFLHGICDVDYTLLDCGANYGYWSALVSSGPYGRKKAIAIEPSGQNFAGLVNNRDLNGGRFEVLRSAVGRTSGTAWLTGRKHESMTIADDTTLQAGEEVAMASLDDLMASYGLKDRRCVVKLDVEGVEIAAMEGGKGLLQTDCVVICEDHGNDRSHEVSRHILKNTRLNLFCYDPEARRYIKLHDVAPLDRIKKAVNRGYNVLATSSAFWESRIMAATA